LTNSGISVNKRKIAKKLSQMSQFIGDLQPVKPTLGSSPWLKYSIFHDSQYYSAKQVIINRYCHDVKSHSLIVDLGSNLTAIRNTHVTGFFERDISTANYLRQNLPDDKIVCQLDIAQELINTLQTTSSILNLFSFGRNAICLGLVHHLCIESGVPIRCLYSALSKLYDNILLEFPSQEDPMVRILIAGKCENIIWDWNEHLVEIANYYEVSASSPITSTRTIHRLKLLAFTR
jgi:hypothetical protein